jgi:hypothetical protein
MAQLYDKKQDKKHFLTFSATISGIGEIIRKIASQNLELFKP